MFSDHVKRIREGLDSTTTLSNLADWIERKTYLNDRPFSFKGHEFQRTVISDAASTSIVVKCAQVGLSEILARWSVAACVTQDNFTIIYTFPTTSDAEKFCRTRLDPCITSSPELARAVSSSLNNAEIKQFGRNSFIYFRGTVSETAALSVPADVIVHDEVDKSNLTQMSVYVSRLQHKPTNIRKLFSTPTVAKYGISAEADTARRYRQVWTCSKCNHTFFPSYFTDVHIPGWDKSKQEITKQNLKDVNWEMAVLLCPKCGREPSPEIQYREWVCENPTENYPANAWFVSPFCAPGVMTPRKLVKASTEFDKYSEFMNQSLGLTAEDADESITFDDVERCIIRAPLDSSELHYMGCDMGLVCHISIGRMAQDGTLLVVHREVVPYTQFEARRQELCRLYRVVVSVHDAQPYVDLVSRITDRDPGAYAAVFTTGTPGVMFSVKDQEEEPQEGRLNMRRINVTRTMSFDHLMAEVKAGRVKVAFNDQLDILWKQHLRSLKRIGKLDRTQEITYHWVKTDGQDHFHFSLLYLMLATKLRGTISGHFNVGSVPILSSFRVKQH